MRYILEKKGQQISNLLDGYQSIHIGGQWRGAADAAGNKERTLNELIAAIKHCYSQHRLLQTLFAFLASASFHGCGNRIWICVNCGLLRFGLLRFE